MRGVWICRPVTHCFVYGVFEGAASRLVYAAVEKIHCDNLFYRHDIAKYVIPGLTGNL